MAETVPERGDAQASGYAWYVLGILFLVYVLNFVDRQIISILAEDIKRDLHLADEDLGFLYGTAFGVFYSLFGIPLGRLADNWHRGRLMVIGLALWSTMTALSGLSRSGGHLAAARIGVGIGEATASPSAYSLISDWFPKRLRATALSIYSAGLYVGGGVSLFIGGLIVQNWNRAYPGGGPLGLVGWQAAFMAVGLPGLIVALWIATLKEPIRGAVEGLPPPPKHPAPFAEFGRELVTIIPPLTLIGAAMGGARALAMNLLAAGITVAVVLGLIGAGEPWPQWTAVGIGAYAVFSWGCALRRRDAATFALIVATPAFVLTVVAYGLNAFLAYAASFWAAPYALRVLHAAPAEAGFFIGASGALGGFLGVTLGGIVADRLRRTNPAGRLIVVIFGAIAPLPFMATAFTASSTWLLYPMLFIGQVCAATALGAAAATTQDLVLPRMRGTATATFFIGTTLLGLALGPYLAGRVSSLSGSLSTGMLSLMLSAPITIAAAIMAYRLVPRAEATREDRARAVGEVI
ncbi:MFS transporter [Microvirga sp. SRT01]|uniref:MFS transporter n=1 Tax=Sphingomonas longa TaxID=2778730 RepID=A0ABS2DA60_9SPHN|nr:MULTISPECIES: MFS transporter [Alphaproteobacteria]MBM6577368.1 MFS transporter [Sphingomonas sp. BT552]MBR7710413.1 MFS transporter [Microvirga sp. SRT01]